jgi:dolichol-phosphate mannosyltransferase
MSPGPQWKLRSFCVIIPMYNEQSGAELCVRRVCAALGRLPVPGKVIAVNDGSGDRTGEILDRLASELGMVAVVHHGRNGGYGEALRTGIRTAAGEDFDYALFMDSDLTNDPQDIGRFLPEMERGIDVIKASRFVDGGRMEGVPWRRGIFSHAGNVVARSLFRVGVRDCTNGFRAVKVKILARMNLRESGFPIIVEELYQAKTLARTFSEIPVVLTSRSADQRPTSFAYKPVVLGKYLRFALKAFLGIRPDLKPESSL